MRDCEPSRLSAHFLICLLLSSVLDGHWSTMFDGERSDPTLQDSHMPASQAHTALVIPQMDTKMRKT